MNKTFYTLAYCILFFPALLCPTSLMAQQWGQHQIGVAGIAYINPTLPYVSTETEGIILKARERKNSPMLMFTYVFRHKKWHWQAGFGRAHFDYDIKNEATAQLIQTPFGQTTYQGGDVNGLRDYRSWLLGTHYTVYERQKWSISSGLNIQFNHYYMSENFTNANDVVIQRWDEQFDSDVRIIPAITSHFSITRRLTLNVFYWLNMHINRNDGLYFSELTVNTQNGATFRNTIQSKHPFLEHAFGASLQVRIGKNHRH